jgi:hypothetical protein
MGKRTPHYLSLSIVGLGILLLSCNQLQNLESADTATPSGPTDIVLTDEEARHIAEATMIAYFSVDYRQPGIWLESLRGFTDESSMRFLENNYQPEIWPDFEEFETVSHAEVVSSTQIITGVDGISDTKWQIWEVSARLDKPWPPGESTEFSALAFPWPEDLSVKAFVNIMEIKGRWQSGLFVAGKIVDYMVQSSTQTAAP